MLDDDTIRGWRKLFEQHGIEGLTSFDMGGSAGFLSAAQEDSLKAWVAASLPRSTRQVGAWIEQEFGLVYESRSGLIALLHRLGLEYHKPNVIPRKLDEEKQKAFIASYEKLLNSLGDDEAVLFADAVHPTHAARPVGCWAPKQEKLAIEQTSGRQRINIHGAIDLETGQTRMIEVETVDAVSTIRLLESIEALYPMLALIHVFLDNARYHHAKLVQEWLSRPDCRIKLHFIPAYCPHLNPIERLWGVMHNMSRTTNATQPAPNSPTRRSISCGKRFPGTGRICAIRSPTISASYRPRIFGLWRERVYLRCDPQISDAQPADEARFRVGADHRPQPSGGCAPTGSAASNRQTEMMYLLGRHILARNCFLRSDYVHRVPEAVRPFHAKRFRQEPTRR